MPFLHLAAHAMFQYQKKAHFINEIQYLHGRIDTEGVNDVVQKLTLLLELLKVRYLSPGLHYPLPI